MASAYPTPTLDAAPADLCNKAVMNREFAFAFAFASDANIKSKQFVFSEMLKHFGLHEKYFTPKKNFDIFAGIDGAFISSSCNGTLTLKQFFGFALE